MGLIFYNYAITELRYTNNLPGLFSSKSELLDFEVGVGEVVDFVELVSNEIESPYWLFFNLVKGIVEF